MIVSRDYLKRTIRWPLIYCLALAVLFSHGSVLFDISYGNVDPSYNYAYGKAAADGLSFGDDFITTYGPLGYLISNYLPANAQRVMLWNIVYLVLLGVGVYWFCKLYIKRGWHRLLLATMLVYALSATKGGGFMEWSYLLTFVLYGFIYLKLPQARRRLLLLVAMGGAAGWFSLMKFTLGVGALLTLLGLCVFGSDTNRERLKQLALAGAAYVVSFVALAKIFGIHSLISYVHSTLLLSAGFSSAMAEFDPETVMATWFVGAALLLVILWPVWREKRRALRYAFLLPLLFEVWKYCVARQDSRLAIVIQVLLPLTVLIYCSLRVRRQNDAWIVVAILMLGVFGLWANKISFRSDFMSIVTAPLVNMRDHQFVTLVGRGNQKQRWAVVSSMGLQNAALPQTMRDKIGHQGVDVFPWETSVIAANDLMWQNSPSPFSFQNFSPYLDKQNATFYNSAKAPPFVIWHHVGASGVHGIDFRHVLWDEPQTTKALLANYQLVESNQEFMLLQKRSAPLKIKITTRTVRADSEGQWIKLPAPDDGTLLANLDIHPGLSGAMGTFLVRDKTYIATVKDSDGKESSYRFLRENDKDLIIGTLPKDWDELVLFVGEHHLSAHTTEFKVTTPLGKDVTVTDLHWIDK